MNSEYRRNALELSGGRKWRRKEGGEGGLLGGGMGTGGWGHRERKESRGIKSRGMIARTDLITQFQSTTKSQNWTETPVWQQKVVLFCLFLLLVCTVQALFNINTNIKPLTCTWIQRNIHTKHLHKDPYVAHTNVKVCWQNKTNKKGELLPHHSTVEQKWLLHHHLQIWSKPLFTNVTKCCYHL